VDSGSWIFETKISPIHPHTPLLYRIGVKQFTHTVAAPSVETTTGSIGGGSAPTLIAFGMIAKAAINPQLKNLRITLKNTFSEYVHNLTSECSNSCELNHYRGKLNWHQHGLNRSCSQSR
jgi:hypothetical protein